MSDADSSYMVKDAFVFAGGGAAGSYQVGCLKAIYELTSIRPDHIFANSAGSLNGAGLSYAGLVELEKMWRGIKRRHDIFGDKFFGSLFSALLGSPSLWTSKPLEQKLNAIVKDKSPKIPLTVNYVDLSTGKLLRANAGELNFEKYLLASASLPILTPAVDGKYADGGVKENTPLGPAIEIGANRIFVFLNSPRDRELPVIEKFKNLKEVVARTIQIVSDELYWADIAYHKETYPNLEVIYFAPSVSTIDTLDFNQAMIGNAIDQGYSEAAAVLQKFNLLKV